MNVLITGSSGLLGKALVECNGSGHNITGVYLGDYELSSSSGARHFRADVRDKVAMSALFADNDIEAAIHTAGISDVDFCENDYEEGYSSNFAGTKNIMELCLKQGARLIYVSTNAVFDGKNPPYDENSPVSPLNNYGKIKLECEKLVMAGMRDYAIVRPILMYGWNNPQERNNLVTFLLEKLKKNEPVNIVNDVYENPLYSRQCAGAIWAVIDKGAKGLYHVSGKDILSRYEYALEIAVVFGLRKELINPVDSSFFPSIAPRPRNTSFITSKAERELGFIPLRLREGLTDMKKRTH